MFDLSQSQMKRMTAVQGRSAVVLGLLLYVVVATGVVAVFAEEAGRWANGRIRMIDALDLPIDSKVRHLAAQVDPRFHHEVGSWAGDENDLWVFFHDHAFNPAVGYEGEFGTLFRVAVPSGEVLARHDGFVWSLEGIFPSSGLTDFLIDLHVNLYPPHPWGIILTALLGLSMLTAVISGVLIHRHLVREPFLAERPGGRLAGVRERHALSGRWSIPFAFTGAYLSLVSTVAGPLVVLSAFDGDGERFEATLWPEDHDTTADSGPAPLASPDYIVADATERAAAPVTFLGISDYGRANARVSTWRSPPPGGLLDVGNEYDGPSRRFLETHPPIGIAPSAAGTLYALMGPLHFGRFAGLLSQLVRGAAGVASCFVILSGFRLWRRRRESTPGWQAFGRGVEAAGYGVPLAMLTAAFGYLLARPAADADWWTPAGSFAGLGAGGMSWSDGLLWRQFDVLAGDALLLIAGAALWRGGTGRQVVPPGTPAQ